MSKNEFSSVEEALDMLSKGIVDISFIKKTDGNLRTMHSTLDRVWIPSSKYNTIDSIIMNSFSAGGRLPLVVWDVNKGDWRSFYMSSIIEIQESLVFGDTTQMVEDMVEEKSSSADGLLTEEDTEGIVSTITGIISGRIAQAKEDAPERIAEFTVSKITQMITTAIKGLKLRGGRG